MAEQKKQNFLQGTALLAAATVIVKLVGALYKVPLNAIIGEKGFGYFSTAYEIYNILLMISTAGLPVAMSRMISQASSLEHYGQVRQVYSTAKRIFLLLGIVGSLLMTGFCRPLARFWNQPDAWAAIGFLGPCVLLICIMSAFRGYFQGQSNMIPTAVSQVLEVVTKLIVGMAAALAFLKPKMLRQLHQTAFAVFSQIGPDRFFLLLRGSDGSGRIVGRIHPHKPAFLRQLLQAGVSSCRGHL